MQKIERYGVIALLFLLVTIVAVTFWNEGAEEPRPQGPGPGGPVAARSPGGGAAPQALRPAGQRTDPQRAAGQGAPGRPQPGAAARPAGGEPRIEPGVPLAQQVPSGQGARPAPEPVGTGLRFQEAAQVPAGARPVAASPGPAIEGPAGGGAQPAGTGRPVAGLDPAPRPAPAERPATSPAAAEGVREVRVAAGDSLARIALRNLGEESRWIEIADLNGITDPRRLQVGQRLRLPAPGGAGAAAPAAPVARTAAAAGPTARPASAPAGSRTYVVQRGEVLGVIAQRECGTVKAIPSILALNPGLDPNRVVAGQTLVLPPAEPGRPPGDERVASSTPSGGATGAATGAAPRRNLVH